MRSRHIRITALAISSALSLYTIVEWVYSYRVKAFYPGGFMIQCRQIICTGTCRHVEHEFLGFGYELEIPTGSEVRVLKWIWFPCWFPLLVFGSYPMLVLIGGPIRRSRWRKHHRCLACGYDLTGNTSGICPECGASALGSNSQVKAVGPEEATS
jgi:hypothetical protein